MNTSLGVAALKLREHFCLSDKPEIMPKIQLSWDTWKLGRSGPPGDRYLSNLRPSSLNVQLALLGRRRKVRDHVSYLSVARAICGIRRYENVLGKNQGSDVLYGYIFLANIEGDARPLIPVSHVAHAHRQNRAVYRPPILNMEQVRLSMGHEEVTRGVSSDKRSTPNSLVEKHTVEKFPRLHDQLSFDGINDTISRARSHYSGQCREDLPTGTFV